MTNTQTASIDLNGMQTGDHVTIEFDIGYVNDFDKHYVGPNSGAQINVHEAQRDGADVRVERVHKLPDFPGVIFSAEGWDGVFETVIENSYYLTGSAATYRTDDIDARTVKILYDPRNDN
jgi:hypothetical protein